MATYPCGALLLLRLLQQYRQKCHPCFFGACIRHKFRCWTIPTIPRFLKCTAPWSLHLAHLRNFCHPYRSLTIWKTHCSFFAFCYNSCCPWSLYRCKRRPTRSMGFGSCWQTSYEISGSFILLLSPDCWWIVSQPGSIFLAPRWWKSRSEWNTRQWDLFWVGCTWFQR